MKKSRGIATVEVPQGLSAKRLLRRNAHLLRRNALALELALELVLALELTLELALAEALDAPWP